jgi:hypothetical protein
MLIEFPPLDCWRGDCSPEHAQAKSPRRAGGGLCKKAACHLHDVEFWNAAEMGANADENGELRLDRAMGFDRTGRLPALLRTWIGERRER